MFWPFRPAGTIGPNFEITGLLFYINYYINCTTFPSQGKVYHISLTVIYNYFKVILSRLKHVLTRKTLAETNNYV